MTSPPDTDPAMVGALAASARLKIPYAWLRNRRQRVRRGIPHYRIGHLVRFRLHELEQWRDAHATVVAPDAERADVR